MKLLSMSLTNFGSYETLDHDFSDSGLVLVQGETGSGKSTLLDGPVWVLFGQTAKGGTADSIRSWTSQGVTRGTITASVGAAEVTITRIRGKASENDLYFQVGQSDPIRGKDMADTQHIMNDRLGLDPYLYTLGAYYNEFSPTGSFFTDKASKRREMFDQLADLSLPSVLSDKIKNSKSLTKKALTVIMGKLNNMEGRLEQIKRTGSAAGGRIIAWDTQQKADIEALVIKDLVFEEDKADRIGKHVALEQAWDQHRVNQLSETNEKCAFLKARLASYSSKCVTCGEPDKNYHKDITALALLDREKVRLMESVNPHIIKQEQIASEGNTYRDRLLGMSEEKNPFVQQILDLSKEQEEIEVLLGSLRIQSTSEQHTHDSLDQLADLADILRGELLKQSVKNIETETNRYLETYFDAEIRVGFTVEGGDKLDIIIHKSGYECDYKQLSKGQRSLLGLCFSASVMTAASNKAGIHFDTIMFDEALTGTSEALTLKAFNLFSELSLRHSTVLVVDHNKSLQDLFSKKYCVSLISDQSIIEES